MPKRITPLSDTKVRSAKPQTKEVKLFDGGGLFLLITPTGGKLWRFKYRYAGKEKKLTLGAYPEISLSDARQRARMHVGFLPTALIPERRKRPRRQQRPQTLKTALKLSQESGMGSSCTLGLRDTLKRSWHGLNKMFSLGSVAGPPERLRLLKYSRF